METFLHYWPFVRGIHWSTVNSLHKGQWCGALMFSLICTRTNDWVNNRDASDLRRHHAHYDVTVIQSVAVWRHACLFTVAVACHSEKKSRKVWLYHFKNSKSYVLLVWNSSLTSVFVFCVKHLSSKFIHGLLLWHLSELMYRQFSNIRCT